MNSAKLQDSRITHKIQFYFCTYRFHTNSEVCVFFPHTSKSTIQLNSDTTWRQHQIPQLGKQNTGLLVTLQLNHLSTLLPVGVPNKHLILTSEVLSKAPSRDSQHSNSYYRWKYLLFPAATPLLESMNQSFHKHIKHVLCTLAGVKIFGAFCFCVSVCVC